MALPSPPITPPRGLAPNPHLTKAQDGVSVCNTKQQSQTHDAFGLLTPPGDLSQLNPELVRAAYAARAALGPRPTHSRNLSHNEVSYYLPSRADGVNDMYVHHSLRAEENVLLPTRVLIAWALALVKHPLLASCVEMKGYSEISFVHRAPRGVDDALADAAQRLEWTDHGDLIDRYLNGPRTLSDATLARLVIKRCETTDHDMVSNGAENQEAMTPYEIMLCTTHFIGDGMALHTLMNEFYTLLSTTDDKTLLALLTAELPDAADSDAAAQPHRIPPSLEDRLPPASCELGRVVGAEEYKRSESRLVGGQVFPLRKGQPRRTAVPTIGYSADDTRRALGKCKANGVTIAHTMFALCNLAWSMQSTTPEPTMIYSALNLRPNMVPTSVNDPASSSYFHLAVGYFNIVLPNLIPAVPAADLLWHRAKLTKQQTVRAVKSPFVVSRARETNIARHKRSVEWAKIDDAAEDASKNPGLGLNIALPDRSAPEPPVQEKNTATLAKTPVPAKATVPKAAALMGVSMLGNLDGMYKHAAFPRLKLETLTTGSRQRPGGLLLFAYTFAGKLWLSLGYDVNGFEPGVIERFWQDVQGLVSEVLLA